MTHDVMRFAWFVEESPCCGRQNVLHVVPDDHPGHVCAIVCDCGAWLEVPRYRMKRRDMNLILVSDN